MKYLLLFCTAFFIVGNVFAQTPAEKPLKIIVTPDHKDWIYKLEQTVKFTVQVFKNGSPATNLRAFYQLGPEKMDYVKTDSVTIANGKIEIDGGTLNVPGFLRCFVNIKYEGITYRISGTAGFEPTEIQPTVTLPPDFNQFWDKAKQELAKVPMDANMRLLTEKCTENVNVYEVSLGNINNSRFYGILCVPKKEGKYPAVLLPPGAGVRSYSGDIRFAEKGIITLQVGIHGIPVTLDAGVYRNLDAGALKDYSGFNLDDKDRYYYKRVYLGCIRANDFLTSLPQFDGEHLGVLGASQGGALSIVTAALDKRVKALAAFHPALCDLTGFLNGRAGGWPLFFWKWSSQTAKKDKMETMGYYDVVNFSKALKVQGFYSWGYNDEVCPPTSVYSAYNSITAPKTLELSLETGHFAYPETYAKAYSWLYEKLKGN